MSEGYVLCGYSQNQQTVKIFGIEIPGCGVNVPLANQLLTHCLPLNSPKLHDQSGGYF